MTVQTNPQEIWEKDVASNDRPAVDWLWQGFISRGSTTLLTSQWKAGKTTLLAMLLSRFEASSHKLPRQNLFAEWPPDFEKPSHPTLWRWLDRAIKSNLLSREGRGSKADPFRYWLPAMEEVSKRNPLYDFYEQDRINRAKLSVSLEQPRRLP